MNNSIQIERFHVQLIYMYNMIYTCLTTSNLTQFSRPSYTSATPEYSPETQQRLKLAATWTEHTYNSKNNDERGHHHSGIEVIGTRFHIIVPNSD